MIATTSKLLLVGCGKMGGAILQRLMAGANAPTCYVVDPHQSRDALPQSPSLHLVAAPKDIPDSFTPDIVLLAIKPQQMADALPAYGRYKNGVFLSIAAGVTIERMGALLGSNDFAIVRSMPNLPASIGFGTTAAVSNKHVNAAQRQMCQSLLESVGTLHWLDDENKLDAVTALSGSGPAYIFALCEAMAEAGIKLGLAPDMAQQLARDTVIGSGALLAQSTDSAAKLRQAVTSPGGTTEAALKHLMDARALPEIMMKAMQAAHDRARELTGASLGKKTA